MPDIIDHDLDLNLNLRLGLASFLSSSHRDQLNLFCPPHDSLGSTEKVGVHGSPEPREGFITHLIFQFITFILYSL